MNIHQVLLGAEEVLGRYWAESPSAEEKALLLTAIHATNFISSTGQHYVFEDYRKGLGSRSSADGSRSSAQAPLKSNAVELLERIRDATQDLEEQELVLGAMDALDFIESTGQAPAFEDYLRDLESSAPPRVTAFFERRDEAEAWLLNHPAPPSTTEVLIGDAHHRAIYVRELNHRKLVPWPSMEYHLGSLKRAGLPPPVASFNTQVEAEAWLKSQLEPPSQAVILIAGEPHLAVHHRDVGHRALYPFSMAAEEKDPGWDDEPGSR
jgi:hypothetical protein